MERSAPGKKLSSRFVAGLTVEDALRVTRDLCAQGFAVTADALGESVCSEAEAIAAANIYHQLLDGIAAGNLNANVSLKLTGVGMDVSSELAERTTGDIVAHAASIGNFVRIDMEGTPYTEATIALAEYLAQQYPGAVGTVLQAYLYRTADDAARLLRQGIRIRLCKGAYKEPPSAAFPEKADVDKNYVKLMQTVLPSGVFCGIATHDPAMIEATERFVAGHGIDRSAFEFQMLYGVKRELQRELVKKGYGVRVYLPFGTDWYPYFMRRLAERPANVLFLLRNLVTK